MEPARKLSENLYDTHHCWVYGKKTPHDGHRNCPKHVEFYSKNKFEKSVHLVGFIIRMFHDARSPERQMHFYTLLELRIMLTKTSQFISEMYQSGFILCVFFCQGNAVGRFQFYS